MTQYGFCPGLLSGDNATSVKGKKNETIAFLKVFFSRLKKKSSCLNKQKASVSSLLPQTLEKHFGLEDYLIAP